MVGFAVGQRIRGDALGLTNGMVERALGDRWQTPNGNDGNGKSIHRADRERRARATDQDPIVLQRRVVQLFAVQLSEQSRSDLS